MDLVLRNQADIERIATLEAALDRYGVHEIPCSDDMEDGKPCRCGLDEALKSRAALDAALAAAKREALGLAISAAEEAIKDGWQTEALEDFVETLRQMAREVKP